MLSGFRKFIMRGNVVDLAIAVVIGAAFGAIVTAVAKDLIGGLIGAVFSTKRFAAAKVTINGSDVIYGVDDHRADQLPDRRRGHLLRRSSCR